MPADGSLPDSLRSPSASERRYALRGLGPLDAEQRKELRVLRASEHDVWVKRGMDFRLAESAGAAQASDDDELVDPATAAEIREQARSEIAELMVHELRHASLRIELAAEQEIENFAESQTKLAVEGFRRIASSLSQLADSGKPARMVEIAIADVVQEAAAEFAQSLWPPDLVGPAQVVAEADPGMLQLAVANSIRNAVESSEAAFHTASPVFVTWGRTDRDAWVAIHDDGVGLDSEPNVLFEAHTTTKGGSMHTGLGLTVARNAMKSMGGDVTLENRLPRGALCELRWPLERTH